MDAPSKLEFAPTSLAWIIEKAEETVRLLNDPEARDISFWRARARYFAEEIVRAVLEKATD